MGKKQAKRQEAAPRTPKMLKVPERPVIGSSLTWNEEQLERFKVGRGREVDATILIPEKWFNFESLDRYQSSIRPLTPD